VRVLIVGQGLAGTLASEAGLNAGLDVHVVDAGMPSASSVAAGMYNPMSFRRIVEVWDARAHWDAMQATYRRFEDLLNQPFLHPLPIRKRIPNADYAALWDSQAATLPWISEVETDGQGGQYGEVHGGGWVDVKALILAWRDHLQAEKRFETRHWTASGSESWDAIVDCRGVASRQDAELGPLDIRANRGEILTVGTKGTPVPTQFIDNFGKWTLPIGGDQHRLGASYEWNRTDLNPTPDTRDFLLATLQKQHDSPLNLEVLEHNAGLRPVSKDRRPAVGPRQGHPSHFVFNGLGTRGVLIGPRWANHLIDGLLGHVQWDPQVHPARLEMTA